jgi:hypothetical protein
MSAEFDARGEANKIENLAKAYMDAFGEEKSSPIEASAKEEQSRQAFVGEMVPPWNNPDHMQAVGKELEKLNQKWFSTLPNVTITADSGQVSSLTFTASPWDYSTKSRSSMVGLRSFKDKPFRRFEY